MTVSEALFITSNITRFHINLSFTIIVFCAVLSNTLIIAKPEILFTNGVPIFINFFSFGFNTICSLGKERYRPFQKAKI